MVFVLLLAGAAVGQDGWARTGGPGRVGLIPFRNGRNPAGVSMPEAPPPPRPLALLGHVASTGSISTAVVLIMRRLGLAATKADPVPPAGFWSNVVGSFGSFGSIVPLSVVLGMFALGWKIISGENTALITRLDTDRQRELTKMDTERKVEQTRMDTERKVEQTRMDTERKAEMVDLKVEQTRMDTERKVEQARMDTERKAEMVDLKVEQTRMDTERKAETSQMLTALQDTLASHLVELKTANAAEVERLVASEIADQRLVSVDDQAQVAKDIDAAVDRLSATTIHATWDEKAEEGTVQATLGKRPFMIVPSSTIDSRSDLAFHLRANGEALQLSVVSENGTKLLATRDLSDVFKGYKVKRFQVLRLLPPPSLLP